MDLMDDVYLMAQIYEEDPIYFNTAFLYDDVLRIGMWLKPLSTNDTKQKDEENGAI